MIGKVASRVIYYVSKREGVYKIFRMNIDGSNPTVVYDNQDPNLTIGKLSASPEGDFLAFTRDLPTTLPGIDLLDLTNGNVMTLTSSGDWPDWSSDSTQIVFQKETGNFLPNADVEIFSMDLTTGNEIQLTDIPGSSVSKTPALSSDGGTITYARADPDEPECAGSPRTAIYLMTGSGTPIGPLSCEGSLILNLDAAPAWSPTGLEIAFTRHWFSLDKLYKVDVATKTILPLTDADGVSFAEFTPAWSPDGTVIALGSDRDGDFDIWLVDPNGGGYLTNLTNSNPDIDGFPTYGWAP